MTRVTLPKQRALETRQRIIEAGLAAFGRRGYSEPTVEQIADEAGVSIGAFYHHFPSKAELFKAILEEHIGDAVIELHEFLPASSFRELIEHFVDGWFQHLETTPAFNRMFREVAETHEAWALAAIAELHQNGARAISRVLALAQRFGLVREDLDPAAGGAVIVTMMEGIEALWSVDRAAVDDPSFKSAWADSIERYIAADNPADIDGFQAEMRRLFGDGVDSK